VEGASERGKRKLIDSWGYSYNVKRQHVKATDWQCTVRPMVRNFLSIIFFLKNLFYKNGSKCEKNKNIQFWCSLQQLQN